MKQKTALFVSLVLTAFLLVTLSTVVTRAFNNDAARGGANAQSDQLPPEAQQIIEERDAAYNQLLAEANAQIEQVQAQNQALADQLEAATGTPDTSGAADNGMPVSVEDATQIAQDAAVSGAVLDGEPELVDFEGRVAYEFVFDQGNVYVDANSGEVLFNGTLVIGPVKITEQEAANIAANYLGRSDVYKVELTQLNGNTVFKVKFNSGDVVYVSLYGNLELVRLANTGGSSGESHEQYNDDDDHEEYEDHDEHEDDD